MTDAEFAVSTVKTSSDRKVEIWCLNIIGCILVSLCTAVYGEKHVDVFLAVALLSFTLLLKDPNDFTESLDGSAFALQVLERRGHKS